MRNSINVIPLCEALFVEEYLTALPLPLVTAALIWTLQLPLPCNQSGPGLDMIQNSPLDDSGQLIQEFQQIPIHARSETVFSDEMLRSGTAL